MLFDVGGTRTTGRPSLRRADVVARVIANAAVAHELEPKVPLVVLTTALPTRAGDGDAALRAVTGRDRPIAAIVDLSDEQSRAQLAAFARASYRSLR